MNDSVKSPPPPPTSHSRLVDAKLAKLPSSSTGTGAGWTRPSSATPSLTPSPGSGGMSSVSPPAPAPGPPLLPHVGKVIQPQHRGAIQPPSRFKPESTNGSSKPAWRNVKQGESAASGIGAQNEFPTAAEVAQGAFRDTLRVITGSHTFSGRLNGVQEEKQTTQTPANPSSATTEADTFRGVHLDPNAHHWDEVRSLFYSPVISATDEL
jgi:serine/arginine repetitive matrix protein 2